MTTTTPSSVPYPSLYKLGEMTHKYFDGQEPTPTGTKLNIFCKDLPAVAEFLDALGAAAGEIAAKEAADKAAAAAAAAAATRITAGVETDDDDEDGEAKKAPAVPAIEIPVPADEW